MRSLKSLINLLRCSAVFVSNILYIAKVLLCSQAVSVISMHWWLSFTKTIYKLKLTTRKYLFDQLGMEGLSRLPMAVKMQNAYHREFWSSSCRHKRQLWPAVRNWDLVLAPLSGHCYVDGITTGVPSIMLLVHKVLLSFTDLVNRNLGSVPQKIFNEDVIPLSTKLKVCYVFLGQDLFIFCSQSRWSCHAALWLICLAISAFLTYLNWKQLNSLACGLR